MKRLALLLLLALPLAADATMEDLSWMAGHWSATVDGVEMEEVWLAPKNGVMLGMHRDAKPNGKASFEFMRVAVVDDNLVFLAQPGGRPVTSFPLVEWGPYLVVFANPKHDDPQRITYTLKDSKLCVTVEGEGQPGESWCWSKK